MKTTKKDVFDEIACPYCGLIKANDKVVGIVKCLGCRHEFQVVTEKYDDAIGDNFPVIE